MIIIHYFSLFVCFILFCVYRLWCIKFIFFQYIFVFVFSFRISRDAHTRILFFSIQPNHHRCVHVVGVSYQTDARVHTQYSHGKEIGSQIITRQEQRMNNIKKKKKTIWICKGIGELPKIICYLCVARPCVCVFVDAGWAVKRCWHRANSSSFRTRTQTHSPMQSSSTDSATQQWDESKKKNILKGRKSSRKLNANI